MSYLIVSDSSSNLFALQGEDYRSVPLHILLGDTDWVDTPEVDLNQFDHAIDTFRGRTASSCPAPDEWLSAFGDAETIFCFTISSGLSGSYNSVMTAKHMYEEQHPDRKVYVIDSLAAGATQALHIYHFQELVKQGLDYETIYQKMLEYRGTTGTLFSLESVMMLASAGRTSMLVAKAIGVLDMRLIGRASKQGTIEVADKARGYKKALIALVKNMLAMGYKGGKVVISHNRNEKGANELAQMLREKFGEVWVDIHRTTVLCSYYAEKGGMIVGFETE